MAVQKFLRGGRGFFFFPVLVQKIKTPGEKEPSSRERERERERERVMQRNLFCSSFRLTRVGSMGAKSSMGTSAEKKKTIPASIICVVSFFGTWRDKKKAALFPGEKKNPTCQKKARACKQSPCKLPMCIHLDSKSIHQTQRLESLTMRECDKYKNKRTKCTIHSHPSYPSWPSWPSLLQSNLLFSFPNVAPVFPGWQCSPSN